MAHIREEGELLSGNARAAATRERDFRDRHVLIVVRGADHVSDLRAFAPTSRTSSRCWSASTAAPTRSSRKG